MPTYKVEFVGKRTFKQYIQADTPAEAIEQLKKWEDVDKIIHIEEN